MMEEHGVKEHYLARDMRDARSRASALLRPGAAGLQPPSDAKLSVKLLQTLLTAEIVCVLRYTRLSVSPLSLKHAMIAAEFQEQANDERRHMLALAERITKLGGIPEFSPPGLASNSSAADEPEAGLPEMVRHNLAAERSVIKHYRDLIRFFAKRDPETCAILKSLLQDEENHMIDMHDLIVMHVSDSVPFVH